jgi:general secretion pathway protein A
MYLEHYGLKRKPFDISPDPSFMWLGEKHKEGLAILKYGILENKGFLLITGDVGTGKTALIRSIEHDVQGRAIVVTIPDPSMNLMDFYNFMASELNMERTFANKGEFLIAFKKLILDAYSSFRRVLLIIDESQRLNNGLLEEIRLLSNIDMAGKVLINIFFVGQTEFRELLAREENRAVRQRITVSYHIQPLTVDEVRQYIAHRLKVAGAPGELFTPEATKAVHDCSRGYPRLINIICDHALMSGYARGVARIDGDIIRECGDELRITIGVAAAPSTSSARPADAAPSVPRSGARPPRQRPAEEEPDRRPSSAGRSFVVFAGAAALLAAAWFFWGERVSDQLARFGLRAEVSSSPPVGAAAPPLSVESRPQAAENPATPAPAPKPAPAVALEAPPPPRAAVEPPPAAREPAAPPVPPSPPPSPRATVAVEPAAPGPVPAPADAFPLKDFVVYFTASSTEIPVYANDLLYAAAALMKSQPSVSAVIEGHTDSIGDATANRIIAGERAASVRNYLVSQGVPAARLSLTAFGADKPAESNATSEGRSKNRRAVIRLVREKPMG